MKYVVTAAEMQSADQYTAEKLGLPSIVLMERAALAVADVICQYDTTEHAEKKARKKGKVCIVCGNGNNGGDGLALGRILNERGYFVHFFIVDDTQRISEANRIQRDILKNMGMTVNTGQPVEEYDIIVDAIFGTGLHREVSGIYQEMIEVLNAADALKVAVDMPSGINSDDGSVLGCAFRADLTVTFAFYKWGQLLYPGKACCGKTICADIGIPESALCEKIPYGRMLQPEDVEDYMPRRIADSHKGTYGKAGIIAGTEQMGGAAILCSRAAMKMGVGYTKVMTERSNREPVLAALPEALLYLYENYQYPLDRLNDCDAIAVGPGIGTGRESEGLLGATLDQYECPMVIDADGINILGQRTDLKAKLIQYAARVKEKGGTVVMTPHKKEFSRLTGIAMDAPAAEWHAQALKTAAELNVVLVLKDAATRIYTPEGKVYVNTTGNPGMSTAGSGDVLTGIICGLLTQMQDGVMAAVLGVYLHGLCGDHAALEGNPYSMTANDMVEALKYVLKRRDRR